jgi:NADH-quinone oxidoreductase subunit G
MSELITITIDGKECQTKSGDTILNVARANDIFIPAICYQTKCSPTLACRLCLVEADGKQVYSCNAKSKDGMIIITNTQNIEQERTAIMEVYDVNHPLQCGVCDQSGECELQNYTLYQKLDKQSYAVRDVNRETAHWGVMNYDPGLCIVCEKCVTICKDMIGSNALGTTKRGADALSIDFKKNMPKDAYAMWNKLNKNIIFFEKDKCIDCGECISVCPVGALVSSDFQYKSNSWELRKIPASNPYSSDCSLIYYEVKHQSIEQNKQQQIYRVTNDSHYTSLSGAARFGFEYSNLVEQKDKTKFDLAVKSIKGCDTIIFNSFITNEEAYILQLLKKKLNIKLVNNDALKYKNFFAEYSKVSGKKLYSGILNDVYNGKLLISVGSYLKSDAPSVKYAFNNAITINKAFGIYFHPMGDKHIEGFGKFGKNIITANNKPFTEDAILYFILDYFGMNLPKDIVDYLETQKETRTKSIIENVKESVVEIIVDEKTGESTEKTKLITKKITKEIEYTYNKLLDTIGTNEEFLDTIDTMFSTVSETYLLENSDTSDIIKKSDKYILIIGEDCINNPNSANIARLVGLIEKYTPFKIIVPPTKTNTLGVSLLCDLDEDISGKTVGLNEDADFMLSALGDGDIDMPTLNQQEGTFVNINKTVVPTNAALSYSGYVLNDLANEILHADVINTIYYTKLIFKGIDFDHLENYFSNDLCEHRGYNLDYSDTTLENCITKCECNTLKIQEDEYIIYNGNPINQFNEFTAVAKQLKNETVSLYISPTIQKKLHVKVGDKIELINENITLILDIKIDDSLTSDISYVPTFDRRIKTANLFDGTKFSKVKIKKV